MCIYIYIYIYIYILGCLCRLGRELSISQNWLKGGQSMAAETKTAW